MHEEAGGKKQELVSRILFVVVHCIVQTVQTRTIREQTRPTTCQSLCAANDRSHLHARNTAILTYDITRLDLANLVRTTKHRRRFDFLPTHSILNRRHFHKSGVFGGLACGA